MTQLSDNFMLDMLSKVQPLQIEVVKTGRTVHLDAHYHEHGWYDNGHAIDIDFYVFDEGGLSQTFEFNSSDTQEQVEAVFTSLVAYIHSL